MPAIDYTGRFYARGKSTSKEGRAGIGFPIKASRASTAMRFAEKMILELLPGWTCGVVRLQENGRVIHTRIVRRTAGKPAGR